LCLHAINDGDVLAPALLKLWFVWHYINSVIIIIIILELRMMELEL